MFPAESILPYERNIFLELNNAHTSFGDLFMWIYSDKMVWIPLVIVYVFIITYRIKWKEAVLLVLASVLVGVLCDQISAEVIKPFFERLRPTHHPDFQNFVETVRGYRGGRYGFVSAHAANGFGIAVFTSLLFRNKRYTITSIIWVLITCYSRVYLGVHFISDVVGGMFLGITMGFFVYYLYLLARKYILKVESDKLRKPVLTKVRGNIMMFTIIVIVISIAVYSLIFQIPN